MFLVVFKKYYYVVYAYFMAILNLFILSLL